MTSAMVCVRTVRSKIRDADIAVASAIAAKSVEDLATSIKAAEGLRFGSDSLTSARAMLTFLIGGNKVRASISEAMAAKDVKQMSAALEVGREKKLESDPLFIACDR